VNDAVRALGVVTLLAASTGCTTIEQKPDPVACTAGFLGDASAPIAFDITAVNASYDTVNLADGGTISLIQPIQGGRVLFVGVRATNVSTCGLTLTGALRDQTSQQVRFDTRPINLIPTGDGWGVTGKIGEDVSGLVSNFANVPVCSNTWSTTAVNGNVYSLEVTLEDQSGRMLEKAIHVTPVCDTPGQEAVDCVCLCRVNYSAQDECPAADGGTD
jgi:hypothetical protein